MTPKLPYVDRKFYSGDMLDCAKAVAGRLHPPYFQRANLTTLLTDSPPDTDMNSSRLSLSL
jgi:hypothetical protein